MEAWELTGRLARLKPSWKGHGDASILQVIDAAARIVAGGEAVVAIVYDRKLRAALRLTDQTDIDLMATESFLAWLAERFGIIEARTAWHAIDIAAGGSAPEAPEQNPSYIRRPRRQV